MYIYMYFFCIDKLLTINNKSDIFTTYTSVTKQIWTELYVVVLNHDFLIIQVCTFLCIYLY